MRCVGRRSRGLISSAIVCCIAAAGHCAEARAEDDDLLEDTWGEIDVTPSVSRFEFWAGAQASQQAWSLYIGTTVAPFAAIQEDGLRLRVVGGYGGYRYAGPRAVGVGSQVVHFKGTVAFTDALVGYQKQLGPVTVKAFAGLATAQYHIAPDDPETTIRGPGLGGKAALETWWNIADRAWSSLDVSWSTLHHSYAARARLGWRFLPAVSAGLEAGGAGNREVDTVRVGGFLRYEWESCPPPAASPTTACGRASTALAQCSRTRHLRRCLGSPASDRLDTKFCATRRSKGDEAAPQSCAIVCRQGNNHLSVTTTGECP